jgi:hypothetical protein
MYVAKMAHTPSFLCSGILAEAATIGGLAHKLVGPRNVNSVLPIALPGKHAHGMDRLGLFSLLNAALETYVHSCTLHRASAFLLFVLAPYYAICILAEPRLGT